MQLWIGVIVALGMVGAVAGIFYLIMQQRATINNKVIQFAAAVLVLPLLLILGLFNILGRETIGVTVGVIIGFVFSNFGKE